MIDAAQIALAVYGVLLIVGGVMGKVKGNSSASLIAGTLTGIAALTGYWKSLQDPMVGFLIGAMVGLLLTGIFVSRFARSRKFMPAGLILILSLVVGVLCMLARQEVEAQMQTSEALVKGPKATQCAFGPTFERSSS